MAGVRGLAKYDEAADAIRWLLGRKPDGIPLDVSDDVARAAGRWADDLETAPRATYTRPGDGREVEFDRNNWPAGTESWAEPQSGLDSIDVGPLDDAPDFELGSPLWHQLDKGWRAHDNLRRNRTANLRNQNPELARIAGADIRARDAEAVRVRSADAERARNLRQGAEELGLAAVTAGLPFLLFDGKEPAPESALTSTSGTEDLVEESRPAPRVEATPSETPAFEEDYSYQARQLIAKLNAMRKRAGGEVPEAKEIMAEVNRLLDLSNKKRNAPDYKPAMPTDYHGEAQMLIRDLNARRRKAGGEVPDAQQVMEKVRRLQGMGDRMRNAD